MRTGRQIAKDRSMSSTNQPSVIISTPVTMALTGFVPRAEKNSRFTILFEGFAIDVLQRRQMVTGAM
jgi:hypothetical protein